ncbi:universal stress protein [Actinomadura rugatobispora]|uniref:Universal stress protein n=1 Tax=Actinomadura rugatobispora TaxID=1994 RepID=A0ABW0ZY94_9ACTN|nr:universal stress protein [Actinomadura rugatobispora]
MRTETLEGQGTSPGIRHSSAEELSQMSDPIIVGTDASADADRAVDWAADEAALRHRPLRIVHSLDAARRELPLVSSSQAARAVSAAGKGILDEAGHRARERHPGIDVTTELIAESTAAVLHDRSEDAFELVVGHRGLGGFTSMMLGSTGLRVAAHAACPVVIVRGDALTRHDEIVVGIDLIGDPAVALGYAFEAAAVRDALVRVVHAWQMGAALVDLKQAIDVSEAEERTRSEVLQRVEPWRKEHPGIEVTEEVVREHPVTALTDASRNADLVVVGALDHHWYKNPWLGSVSHGVIHHAHCPVAVARAK